MQRVMRSMTQRRALLRQTRAIRYSTRPMTTVTASASATAAASSSSSATPRSAAATPLSTPFNSSTQLLSYSVSLYRYPPPVQVSNEGLNGRMAAHGQVRFVGLDPPALAVNKPQISAGSVLLDPIHQKQHKDLARAQRLKFEQQSRQLKLDDSPAQRLLPSGEVAEASFDEMDDRQTTDFDTHMLLKVVRYARRYEGNTNWLNKEDPTAAAAAAGTWIHAGSTGDCEVATAYKVICAADSVRLIEKEVGSLIAPFATVKGSNLSSRRAEKFRSFRGSRFLGNSSNTTPIQNDATIASLFDKGPLQIEIVPSTPLGHAVFLTHEGEHTNKSVFQFRVNEGRSIQRGDLPRLLWFRRVRSMVFGVIIIVGGMTIVHWIADRITASTKQSKEAMERMYMQQQQSRISEMIWALGQSKKVTKEEEEAAKKKEAIRDQMMEREQAEVRAIAAAARATEQQAKKP